MTRLPNDRMVRSGAPIKAPVKTLTCNIDLKAASTEQFNFSSAEWSEGDHHHQHRDGGAGDRVRRAVPPLQAAAGWRQPGLASPL